MLLTVIKYTSPRRREFVFKEILKRLKLEQASPLSGVDPHEPPDGTALPIFTPFHFRKKIKVI